MGRTNPAVLPVPVCAPASKSPPASTAGIACVCIGVGMVYPWSATARSSAPDSPSLVNGMRAFVSSHTPPRGRPVTAKRDKRRGRNYEVEIDCGKGTGTRAAGCIIHGKQGQARLSSSKVGSDSTFQVCREAGILTRQTGNRSASQSDRMTKQASFTPQELEQLAERTLEDYRGRAEQFREGT